MICEACWTQPVAVVGPMLVRIPSRMILDMHESASISVVMICTLACPLGISQSKRSTAGESALVGVWRTIVFLPVALRNMTQNCLASDSLMERRMLSFIVRRGTDSTMEMMISSWLARMVVSRRAVDFLFLFPMTVSKGVSAP